MKSVLTAILAITVVSIMGTSAMAETSSITSNATLNKEFFADYNARYNQTITTPEGEQAVRAAYTALRDHYTDIPYSVVETIQSVEQKGFSNKYHQIITNIIGERTYLADVDSIETYPGSNVITAHGVFKNEIKGITPKILSSLYVNSDTKTTSTPEDKYVITLENPNLISGKYAVIELVAKSGQENIDVQFTKPIQVIFSHLDPTLVPFYSEPGENTAERIFKCQQTGNYTQKLGKDQSMCFFTDRSEIIILTKQTGEYGLHPKKLNGIVAANMKYVASDFVNPITNTPASHNYHNDIFNPKCVDKIRFNANAKFAENGDVLVNIKLTESQRENIDQFSIIIVDMNLKSGSNVIATIPYAVQGLDNNYVISTQNGTITMHDNQTHPPRNHDQSIVTLNDQSFGVIVQAVSFDKTLPNDSLYYYNDELYYMHKITRIVNQQAVALGSDIPIGTMFYQKGEIYKPMGDTITMSNESRCKLYMTPIIIANLQVSGTADFAERQYGKYLVTIDGPNMNNKIGDVITKYQLVSDDGEINHNIPVSNEDISLVVKGSKIGGHGNLTIYAHASEGHIVAVGELEFLRSYPVHRD